MRSHTCKGPEGAPPPPHDPGTRKVVAQIGGWQIRMFGPKDPKVQFFVPRGFLHAQLWHPVARVSVLTPSGLTGGVFEVFPIDGWKVRLTAAALRQAVVLEHGVRLPSLTRIASVIEWYVRAAERRARNSRSTTNGASAAG